MSSSPRTVRIFSNGWKCAFKKNPELGDIVEINHFGKEGVNVQRRGTYAREAGRRYREELAHRLITNCIIEGLQ